MFLTNRQVSLSVTVTITGSINSPEVEVSEGGHGSDDNTGGDHCEGISGHLQSPPASQILDSDWRS